MRNCSHCKLNKEDSEFYQNKGKPDSYCKECRKAASAKYRKANPDKVVSYKREYDAGLTKQERADRKRWQRYGLTPFVFFEMLNMQEYKCMICLDPIDEHSARVDHDHKHCGPNKGCEVCVRGLLCDYCNKMLGSARDRIDVLKRAISYLVTDVDRQKQVNEFPKIILATSLQRPATTNLLRIE